MPQGNLVASSIAVANSTDGKSNDARQSFIMSDGRHLAIFGPDGSTSLQYATSADGVTWSAHASLNTVNGSNGTINSIVQAGNTLYAFGATTSSGLSQGPLACLIEVWAYSTSTLLITTQNYVSWALEVPQMIACYDAVNAVCHVATAGPGVIQMGTFIPATPSNTFGISTQTNVTSPVIRDIVCYTASGTTTVLVLYTAAGGLFLLPMTTYSGGDYYTLGAIETITTQAVLGAAASLDAGNNLDVVYVASNNLYATRRTGTNVYGASVNIAGAVLSGTISTVPNGSDLVVLYQSGANQGNGEIYLVWRTAGVWGNPTRFAGGDSGGYAMPKAAPVVSGGAVYAIYAASGSVYASSTLASNVSNAPTVTAPAGTESSLTPTVITVYNNPNAPTDTQSAFEVKVTSGATTMWDSGKVSQPSGSIGYGLNSNTSDPNYVAPVALAYGTTYTVTARTWDVINNTASAWSTAVTFTPQQGGTATITQIVDNGATLTATPATVSGATISSTTVSWSQAASHTATQYQGRLYANDGVTLLAATAWTLLTTALASGSTATLAPWSPAMNNSTTYQYAVALQDGTTGLQSESAHWALNTVWTPPSPVTGLTVTPQPTTGNIVLTWTNPPAV
jgi:hypothetical protein